MLLALANNELPSNNIDCAVFSKLPNDRWHVAAPTTFETGTQRVNLSRMPDAVQIGDFDMYDVLDRSALVALSARNNRRGGQRRAYPSFGVATSVQLSFKG